MKENSKYLIYGLFDPENEELRYIGLTTESLDIRLSNHIAKSKLSRFSHKNNWIKLLLKCGLKPRIQKIQELYNIEDLKGAEIYWIKYFREKGCKLTNIGDGGEAAYGRKHTPEAKYKMKLAHKGIKVIDTINGKIYNSFHEAALDTGTYASHVSRVCKGIYRQINGHIFKFYKEETIC